MAIEEMDSVSVYQLLNRNLLLAIIKSALPRMIDYQRAVGGK